jgi:hypothetical protein
MSAGLSGTGASMPLYASTFIEDKATIDAHNVCVVRFRPGHAGIWSKPQPHPLPPPLSKSQVLGRMTLRRPGLNSLLAACAAWIKDQAITPATTRHRQSCLLASLDSPCGSSLPLAVAEDLLWGALGLKDRLRNSQGE